MSDALKLTACFGERDRVEGRLVADALLDLYGSSAVALSVLLRGAEGFGPRHALRTDQLLTLSEDLPLVAVAIDRPGRIQALVPQVQALQRHGLITLERAHLDDGQDGAALAAAPPLGEADEDGQARLTVHLGRRERAQGRPAFVAVTAVARRHGAAGAVVLLGVDGTVRGRRARARFLGANAEVPVLVEVVGPGDRLAAALPELRALAPRALLTLERVQLCKRDGVVLTAPSVVPGADDHGRALWQRLTVHAGEGAAHAGPSVHGDIVRALRRAGHAGATTLRGVWGFHGDHDPHGDRLLQLRRHAPAMTVLVDAPDRIASAFAIVDALTPRSGLVTSEVVPAMLAGGRGGGLGLAEPRG